MKKEEKAKELIKQLGELFEEEQFIRVSGFSRKNNKAHFEYVRDFRFESQEDLEKCWQVLISINGYCTYKKALLPNNFYTPEKWESNWVNTYHKLPIRKYKGEIGKDILPF